MSIALLLLAAALLQPPGLCVEQPVAGDLVDQGNRGGGIGFRASLQILDLVAHERESEGRRQVAVVYFFPEGMRWSRHIGGPRPFRNPSTGCLEPWMRVVSDAWNLDPQAPRPPIDASRRPPMSDPETWANAVRFEATLDGRARTLSVGDISYDLAGGTVFAVIFDDELRPEVHQTDATLGDLPIDETLRGLVVQRLTEEPPDPSSLRIEPPPRPTPPRRR